MVKYPLVLTDLKSIEKHLNGMTNKDNKFLYKHMFDALKDPLINRSLELHVDRNNATEVITLTLKNTLTGENIK